MIERERANPKLRLFVQHAVGRIYLWKRFASKLLRASEPRPREASVRAQLARVDHEVDRVIANQVPGIRGELVLELRNEMGRAVQAHSLVTSKADAQQMIEACEVIHVGVAHEHIADTQQ